MKVAIITPTIGTDYLAKNLSSVSSQTYKDLKHIVVADGPQYHAKVEDIVHQYKYKGSDKKIVFNLPENTGANGYNGHRIYASIPYLIDADYFIFLDEDNWIDENHVQSLVDIAKKYDWVFSLRKIIDKEDNYICNDDCESLGLWNTCLSANEYFVDVGCYFLPKRIALQTASIWYRRARHPQEQPEVDRLLISVLRQNNLSYGTTGEYTLNYRVGNRADSVQAEFFIRGNEFMKQKFGGEFPWNSKQKIIDNIGPGITIIS
jgi:glycosyltransferase involved in cell wall biosynthesis